MIIGEEDMTTVPCKKKVIFIFSLWAVFFAMFGCTNPRPFPGKSSLTNQTNMVLTSVATSISPITSFASRDPVYAMTWSPEGRLLAIGGQRRLLLWDTAERTISQTWAGLSGDITAIAFSPDAEILAAGSYQAINLWHTGSGRHLATFSGQGGYITALAFSPNGRYLASASSREKTTITIRDVSERQITDELTYTTQYANRVSTLIFSPKGDLLAAVGLDRQIRVWPVKGGTSQGQAPRIFSDPMMNPRDIAFSPNQEILAVGSTEGQILLFDLQKGDIIRTFEGHQGGVEALVFSDKGLISSGRDRMFRHWDLWTGAVLKTEQITRLAETVALSKDGRFAAARKRSGIEIFSLAETRGIPPVIAILTPAINEILHQSQIRLSGKIVDDQGIAKVVIRINGVIHGMQQRKGARDLKIRMKAAKKKQRPREIQLDELISLKAGENVITIRAFDVDGLSRSETLRVTYKPDQGAVWAAVIGISRYQYVKGLRYADADAKAFYDYLVKDNHIPEDHITLLLNEEASLQRLRDLLGVELKEKARKKDTVIIFYAGHGAPEPDRSSLDGDGLEKYLLPYDADPRRLYSTALPMREISKIFSRISAERVIMLQDTCFSGSSGKSDIGGRTIQTAMLRSPIADHFLDHMTQGKGRVIITASEANEVSLERDDLKHGVFTYYLLEALKLGDVDGDGLITTNEVFRYVSEKVPQATAQNQHPVKRGVETSEIVLGRVRGEERHGR